MEAVGAHPRCVLWGCLSPCPEDSDSRSLPQGPQRPVLWVTGLEGQIRGCGGGRVPVFEHTHPLWGLLNWSVPSHR